MEKSKMRKSMIIAVCLFGLLAVGMGAIGTASDDGMRGFFGRADVIQGIVEIDHGTGTNQPGYIMIESCDGTAFWVFADNSGGLRGHTSAPTADGDGVALAYTDTVGTAHLADADWGDFTVSSGSATLDVNTVAAAELADGDLGDGTFTSGVFALDDDVIAAAEMADADHGDGTWASGVFSLDAEATVNLLSATTVALNANADTTIYTVPAGKRCILSHAILVAGADASTTDISIGANGSETDFVGAIDLGNVDAQYDACRLAPVPVAAAASAALEKSYAATTVIEAQVTNQAGGATNTLYLFGTLY